MPAVRLDDLRDFDEVGSSFSGSLPQQGRGALARALIAGKAAALTVHDFELSERCSSGRRITFFDADSLRLRADRGDRGHAVTSCERRQRKQESEKRVGEDFEKRTRDHDRAHGTQLLRAAATECSANGLGLPFSAYWTHAEVAGSFACARSALAWGSVQIFAP